MRQMAQGDLLFTRCRDAEARGDHVTPEGGRLIIARGEATGHHHSVIDRPGVTLRRESESVSYLTIEALTGEVAVEHQEHGAQGLAPGTYRVVTRQREATDDDEGWGWVGD